jgi:hypothetical protein
MRLGTKVQSNSRIQYASNQTTLVPRKLDPGSSSKVGLKEAWLAQILRKMPYSRNLKV